MTHDKNNDKYTFSFEKLEIWHHAVDLADCTINLLDALPPNKYPKLTALMEATVSQVAQNIAEGKGKQHKNDFIQSLYRAEGSLFEFLTLTELLKRRGCIGEREGGTIRGHAVVIDR